MQSERDDRRLPVNAHRQPQASDGGAGESDDLGSGDFSLDDLLRRYWQPLVAYAAGLLRSADAAEDVVQEAFIRVWERRAQWTADDSLRSLLYRIARNLAFNEQRSQRVRSRWSESQPADEHSSTTPLQVVQAGELSEAVERAIATLPERRREVFVLVRFHGLSYRQVAEVMGISTQTVANQMSVALTDLRRCLDAFLDQPTRPVAVRAPSGNTDQKPHLAAATRGP